jgi:amino acid adenylation domain-containing protein
MKDLSKGIGDLSVEDRERLFQRLFQHEQRQDAGSGRIGRQRREPGGIPLSFGQQRLWFLDQLMPGGGLYNLPTGAYLQGPLNVAALQRSFNEVVRRHEVLRTSFTTAEGRPVQVIAPLLVFELPMLDLRTLTASERARYALQCASVESQRPFNLTRGPLLRVLLIRLDEYDHQLLITMHHSISDGWSIGLFIQELTALYAAYCAGQGSPLAALPIQYADFAIWQRQSQGEAVLAAQLAYWKQRLDNGLLPALELPIDHPRPVTPSFQGAGHTFVLSPALRGALLALSQREGCTLFMTVLAAFQVLLGRYSGQDDIVIGTDIANRTRAETQQLIGFFVNQLVLRTDLSGDPSFLSLLRQIRELTLEAYAHQDLPFEHLVRELNPERSLAHTPLFQVKMIFQNTPMPDLHMADLTIRPVDNLPSVARFDLVLTLMETAQGLSGTLVYSTDLFTAPMIERMQGHFQTLLAGIVADPTRKIGALPLVTQPERQQLLVEWNATGASHRHDQCLPQLFAAQAARTPHGVALVSGSEHLTYQELNARANQVAYYLQSLGSGPETLVGLCVERSTAQIIGLLGILKAGGAYVPLDPLYPAERLAFLLADSQIALLLTQERLLDTLPASWALAVALDANWEAIARQPIENPISAVRPDNLAYVIYTSGSTGTPRGVQVSHRGLGNLVAAQARAFQIGSGSRVLQFASLSFDAAVSEVSTALLTGATLVVAGQDDMLPGSALTRLVQMQSITTVTLPPSVLAMVSGTTFPTVQSLIVAGEACSAELAARWAGGRRFVNAYGPTEVTVCAMIGIWSAGCRTPPIGRPISNTQVYLLDAGLEPTPIGVTGEIYIGGDGLAQGYLRNAALTAERFIAHPFSTTPGARLYKTGDRARYLPDGQIVYVGRRDHQVKLRGFRVELGEIEATLNQHPAVQEAVVVAREDTPNDVRLVAYVVQGPGVRAQGPGEAPVERLPSDTRTLIPELRNFLRERLPAYMIPSAVVLLDRLPMAPNGKVDRRALRESRQPGPIPETDQAAPRTPVEALLAQIWMDVLRVEQVGIHTNFFDLGGHSLLATQVIARVRDTFGIELPLRSLFEAPTVSALARQCESTNRDALGLLAPPLEPMPHAGPAPLSFAQQRLWFLDQMYPASPVYHVPLAMRLSGTLDVLKLQRSLRMIVARHGSLRTTFLLQDGQPVQRVAGAQEVPLLLLDLKALPAETRLDHARRLATAETQRLFDLARGPLMRATLLWVAPHEYLAVLTMHHIVADGWSLGVLVRELGVLYAAAAGTVPVLPELPIQYADYAIWQRQWLRGAVLEGQLAYWRQQLDDLPVLQLTTDYPRPPSTTFRGARQHLALSPALCAELEMLSRRTGVTLFMTLLAAWQVLLSRYSSQEDIVVGTPIANRTHGATEQLIGFFTNTLVLRTDVSGHPSFRELLSRVRTVCLDAYAHQEVPFEQVVEAVQPERELDRHPLFEVMFILQNTPLASLELPGVTLHPLEIESTTTKFDLVLSLGETANGLEGTAEYSTDLFAPTTIKRMLRDFQTLLGGIVADPDQAITDLPLLTAAELQLLLVDWNGAAGAPPQVPYVHQLFAAQVARTPDVVAVIFDGSGVGPEQLTYRELDARANRLAWHLRTLGVGPEARVGICTDRSLDMVIGLLGILKAGAAYVPLDPAYPAERLAFMLEDAHMPVLLTQRRLVGRLPGHEARVICLDTDWATVARAPAEHLDTITSADNLIYVLYTSGSTGRPKGVAMSHRSLVNMLMWQLDSLSPGAARTLQFASFSFDVAFQEIFSAWCAGGTLVLITEDERHDTTELLRALARQAVERLFLPFVALQHLAELIGTSGGLPAHLREIITAGEQLRITPAIANMCSALPNCVLHNHYGPTESHAATSFTLTDSPRDWPVLPPIGRPITNTRIYLLDRHWQLTPLGVPGELYIAGVSLARGYLHRPELTAERFLPNPFSAGREQMADGRLDNPTIGYRLYRTGDLARYRLDGNLEFLGRIDHQVKIRGFRVELGEIAAVLGQHPQLREAVVLAREDLPGNKRLVAYVVTSDEVHLTSSQDSSLVSDHPSLAGELRAFLREKLPDYMIPDAFVSLSALPLTPNGKLDRRALPVPTPTRLDLTSPFTGPQTPVQELLATLWADLLGVEHVGIHDNFFELGGHSLLATRLVTRIRAVFTVELPLRTLFEAPTIAALAARITHIQRDGASPLPLAPVERSGPLPLSYAQQRLWFLDQLQPASPAYNIPIALWLIGSLNIAALQRSLNQIVRRHEALRTTFAMVNGQPVQVIAPAAPVPLPVLDLQGLTVDERDNVALLLATGEAQHPFDLARGPLLRATLLRRSTGEHLALLVLHHIIADGWSIDVLMRELTTIYSAAVAGKPHHLLPLPIQYADFAIWQRAWLQGAVLEQQLAYWQAQLADLPGLVLPTDRPRPPIQTFQGAIQGIACPPVLREGLLALSWQTGVTLFMSLLAAFQVLLARYSSQYDIVVGAPVANRAPAEVEGLIGFFVNTLVLRTDLRGNPSFRTLLGRVRTVCLDAYVHQELPFEQIVEALQPMRDLSRHPLFQVMFDLQNRLSTPMEFRGLAMQPLAIDKQTVKFDLSMSLAETPDGLMGSLEFTTDLFDATTIRRMCSHFQTLLAGIVAQPDRPIGQLALLTAAEHAQLVTWQTTQVARLPVAGVYDLFATQAARTPDAIALIQDQQHLTYRGLHDRAHRLAQVLRQHGVGPEVRVGLFLAPSPDLVIGLLGVLAAGGAYVPLDPSYPPVRLAFMLADSQATVLLTQQHLRDLLPPHTARLLVLDQPWPDSPGAPLRAAVTPDQLAYLLYTSGSTGRPKGVLVAQRSLLNLLMVSQQQFGVQPGDVIPALASFAFDIALFELLTPLIAGGSVRLLSREQVRDLPPLLDTLAHCTLLHGVPSLLRHLLDAIDALGAARPRYRQLRAVFVGGDVVPPTLLTALRATFEAAQVWVLYGPTEATIIATRYAVPDNGPLHGQPIGQPLPNLVVLLLDRQLQLVPVGVEGELYLGGAGVARGYHGQPALTAERFVPNPFAATNDERRTTNDDDSDRACVLRPASCVRLYKTGDLARYRLDGELEYLGRRDAQVKLRGYRIEPGEVEAALSEHPSVRESVVLAREDLPGDKRLVAYVVTNDEVHPTSSQDSSLFGELRAFLKEKLPDYMIPSTFVLLDHLPLAPHGKIDRQALPIPDSARTEPDETFVAPRTPEERRLARIWEELLGRRPIGITDNFFALGGHSLLAMRLIGQIQQQFGQALPLSALFRGATVEQLAALLRHRIPAAPAAPLIQIRPGGAALPFFCVHAVGGDVFSYYALADHLDADRPFYGLRASGLDSEAEPYTNIPALVTHYIAAVRAVQPRGPYLLGGWSMGGAIAFEMARQLQQQGQAVALLVLLDSFAPVAASRADDAAVLSQFVHDVSATFGQEFDIPIEMLCQQGPEEQLSYVLALGHQLNAFPADIGLAQLRARFAVFKANLQAVADYIPQPLATRTILIRSAATAAQHAAEPTLGWGALVGDALELCIVPGDHYTMLSSPHVQVVAKRLGAYLNQPQPA